VGFGDGFFEGDGGFGEFLADVDVGDFSTDGEGGDDHPFDELMGVLMHDVAVLKGARL